MSKVLTLTELLDRDFTGENVLIIGCPASGKSTIMQMIHDRQKIGHFIFHSDDYMHHGYEQSLYALIDDYKKLRSELDGSSEHPLPLDAYSKHPIFIEGILGYRLLRKGVELDCYYPDVVIELLITDERMEQTYNESRDPEKLKGARSQTKACATILGKYKEMFIPDGKYPEWIQINNDY